jgi:hypothetical protein
MKRQQYFGILLFGIGILFLMGCGNFISSSKTVSLANQGEISGKVYDARRYDVNVAQYFPVANAKLYIGTIEAETTADGSYHFSNVPAGEIAITASAEGYYTQTMVANRNVINIYLDNGSFPVASGASTITGTVYGLPGGVNYVDVCAYTPIQNTVFSQYNSALFKYSVPNAPDAGEIYLVANYYPGPVYTYNRFAMSPGTKEVDLDFGNSINYLTVEAKSLAGYEEPHVVIFLSAGARLITNLYYGNSGTITSLPRLLSGDVLTVIAYAAKTDGVSKEVVARELYKYVQPGEKVEMNLEEVPSVFQTAPDDNVQIGNSPAFTWTAIPDEQVIYLIRLAKANPDQLIWSGWTRNNFIQLPEMINLVNGQDYKWIVAAAKILNVDLADCRNESSQTYVSWESVSDWRSFTYAK